MSKLMNTMRFYEDNAVYINYYNEEKKISFVISFMINEMKLEKKCRLNSF